MVQWPPKFLPEILGEGGVALADDGYENRSSAFGLQNMTLPSFPLLENGCEDILEGVWHCKGMDPG